MNEIIISKLKEIEKEFDVKILYACESGSRAWGFASPDSDYDVRFIYVHNRAHYLSIDDQRDVVELPINDLLDINGWELRKALRLFRKSNAPLYEWFQSPIIYQADSSFLSEMKELMKSYFSPRSMMHHYLSMTNGVVGNDLSATDVKLKKYFYALRPVLASRWIADRQEVPPMEFSKLRVFLDIELNPIVDELLLTKSKVDEKFTIKPIVKIHDWLSKQIEYCDSRVPAASPTVDSKVLNGLFRKRLV
jgi:uncharacterized protein